MLANLMEENILLLLGGCNNSSTPTCGGGTDTLTKIWRGGTGTNIDVPGVENITADATPSSSSSSYRGHVITPIIAAHSSVSSDSAADYCNNMVYGGHSDWYLGAKSEMNYLYCKAAGVPSHSTANPQAAVNCTSMGGKTADLTGFVTTAASYYIGASEFAADRIWKQSFNNGDNDNGYKYQSFYVRCMRRQ